MNQMTRESVSSNDMRATTMGMTNSFSLREVSLLWKLNLARIIGGSCGADAGK